MLEDEVASDEEAVMMAADDPSDDGPMVMVDGETIVLSKLSNEDIARMSDEEHKKWFGTRDDIEIEFDLLEGTDPVPDGDERFLHDLWEERRNAHRAARQLDEDDGYLSVDNSEDENEVEQPASAEEDSDIEGFAELPPDSVLYDAVECTLARLFASCRDDCSLDELMDELFATGYQHYQQAAVEAILNAMDGDPSGCLGFRDGWIRLRHA